MTPARPPRLSLLALLAALLLGACRPGISASPQAEPTPPASTYPPSSQAPPATPTSSPTSTPEPLAPTETPTSTATQVPSPTLTSAARTSLLFTGVIVPARCVQASIDEKNDPDYPYAEVGGLISAADLAVGTLNATISDYPPHTGCVRTYVLVGGAENADALALAGFDVMSVATNHIKNCGLTNCGDQAFFDTLANLRRVGIQPVGAGANHQEAMQPVVINLNGVRFAIVSLGQIEPQAFAGEDSPGIAVLNQENLKAAIGAAREQAEVVIAMPHWGPEDAAWPSYIQRNLARQLVAAGADLVVGNHTHVAQAMQEIHGTPVFYGLGNFVFDQTWARDHQQGLILKVYFEGQRYTGYEFIPTHVDGDGRVHLAGPDEAAEILQRVKEAGQGLD
jgi:poly-gamma-glutamate capsule biosynthesis protein CapA/YwtB (metallophosphatase superfamily)